MAVADRAPGDDRVRTGRSAREEIMARLRAADPPAGAAVGIPVPREYAVDPPTGAPADREPEADGAAVDDPVGLFTDRLLDYQATVRRCGADELGATLAELLHGVPAVAVPPGLPGRWLSAYPGKVHRDGDPRPLTVPDLDAPGLTVLTGCAVAVAQTGTLILDARADQGRRLLTLVPDHHVCVVRVAQIVANVPQALHRLADPTRPLTLISGPSATSDIELNRVEGVHGPRRLDVVLIR